MPNTFGHFGVQGAASRLLFRDVDIRWILLGCLAPDVPWIFSRIAGGIDPFGSMIYFIAQASLAVTLILCAALALLTPRPRLLFGVFALNALVHLLLDACQVKWGNGVAILAPFSWSLTHFDWFWAEDWPSHVLTALGVVLVAWFWRRGLWGPLRLDLRRARIAVALLVAYFLVPLAMTGPAYRADVRFARTLDENRTGHPVAFERARYDGELHGWDGRVYRLHPPPATDGAILSVRGTLRPGQVIDVQAVHVHAGRHRDYASTVAIALLGMSFLVGIRRGNRPAVRSRPSADDGQPAEC